MQEIWHKLSADEMLSVLEAVNHEIDPISFHSESTMVRAQTLSFYEHYKLYELTDFSAVPPAKKFALYAPKQNAQMIVWTNEPIYHINSKAPLLLSEQTVADYVRFFFHYVRGRHGRFLIVETVDEIKWQNDPPPQGRKAMQDILSPVTLIKRADNGDYILSAFMVFKDALFKTRITVDLNGIVTLSDEELKVEGLPVLTDQLVA
jgi:hypothetical protein